MFTRRLFIVSTVATAGLARIPNALAAARNEPTEKEVYFDPGNPILGNPKGDVIIAEFFDYQCPYCKRDFPNVRDVVEKDGNVRHVLKDWPIFGPVSVYASHLALGAFHSDGFEAALDALMATRARLTERQVDAALEKAGADVTALKNAFKANAKKIDATLARNNAQAEAFGFQGTPSYVIGHNLYGGVLDRNALHDAISRARNPAQ